MIEPEVEAIVLDRLNAKPPFIKELTQDEFLLVCLLSILAGFCIMLLLLYFLWGSNLFAFGFLSIISGWPVGKKIFEFANENKKGKPNGYLGQRIHCLLTKRVSWYVPPFIYHKGSWEVFRR